MKYNMRIDSMDIGKVCKGDIGEILAIHILRRKFGGFSYVKLRGLRKQFEDRGYWEKDFFSKKDSCMVKMKYNIDSNEFEHFIKDKEILEDLDYLFNTINTKVFDYCISFNDGIVNKIYSRSFIFLEVKLNGGGLTKHQKEIANKVNSDVCLMCVDIDVADNCNFSFQQIS